MLADIFNADLSNEEAFDVHSMHFKSTRGSIQFQHKYALESLKYEIFANDA